MALYRGWNREEMRQAGAISLEPSTTKNTSLSSFTPINHNHVQPRFITPTKTLISKALDSDALYNLPQDVLPEVAPKKSRKRGPAQNNKGRAVSLGTVWEYNDDEDVQEGAGTRDPIPKKRKAAPSKRSKSTKAPSNTLTQILDNGEDVQQGHAISHEPQNSQLTTPPDPTNKTKKMTVSLTAQCKARKTKQFKSPTITKPLVAPEKSSKADVPSSKPASTHRGWTTTQDAIRLTKTTLDKLAAFRYRPLADAVAREISMDGPVSQGAGPALDQDHEQQLVARDVCEPSSEYGPVPSIDSLLSHSAFEGRKMQIDNMSKEIEVQELAEIHFPDTEMILSPTHDDFFADALWNVGSSSQAAPITSQIAVNREAEKSQHDQLDLLVHIHSGASGNIHLDHTLPSSAQVSSGIFPDLSLSQAEPTQHVANSFKPTSSEAKALGYLPDSIGIEQHSQKFSETIEAEISLTQNRASIAYLFSEEAIEHAEDAGVFDDEEEDVPLEGLPVAKTDFDDEILLPLLPSESYFLMGRMTDVQVERSDIDDVQGIARNVSRDYDTDDFDEGLDDSDLLGMVSDAVIPGTQFIVISKEEETRTLPPSHPGDSSSALARAIFTSGELVDLTHAVADLQSATGNVRSPSLQLLSSEPDDEYPIDEDDEEVFNRLDLMTVGVIEKFHAPASLQYAFGDDLGTGEVYDSSLQFSPPKLQRTTASSKAHTDIASTTESPTRRSVDEPSPWAEDEDWNFLHPNSAAEEPDLQAMSESFVELRQQNIADRPSSLSSPRSQECSHPADSTTTPESPTQADLINVARILDDSHEYTPLQPFARPEFPILTRDRSPITGVSAQTFLRVCFRIGEMFKEGGRCEALKQDTVIELFARVTFSSREPGTTKQHFQFADLWHDRPPFPNGVLANYKSTGLVESESKMFLGCEKGTLSRCLGRLKRDSKGATGWTLHILNIRMTDWEEIRWTKRIVSAGLVKSEGQGLSKA